MAYLYKNAKVRAKTIDSIWEEVDISAMDINAIFNKYRRVYLILTNSFITGDVFLDLESVRNRIGIYFGTLILTDWLASLGNESLPTTNTLPSLIEKPVLFSDVWRAGYSIRKVDRKRSPDAEIPDGEKNDLLISKSTVDFREWWRFCLVTVNGFFHRVGGSQEGLYVVDGGRTGRLGNNNCVGMYSFKEVGAIETIPILPSMIFKTRPDQLMSNFVNIKLPRPIPNKTVLLVLGGYLHVLDSAYRMISEQSLRIDFNNLSFPERIYDSIKTLNLDPLALEVSPKNSKQFSVSDLYSEKTILAYLTLPQSFIVVVDTPYMYARKHSVEKTELPGRFIASIPFKPLPLISRLGRAFDYIPQEEYGRFILATENAEDPSYNFNTTHWRDENSIDPTQESAKPWRFARAELMEFGRIP